jgi:hypothetical protein
VYRILTGKEVFEGNAQDVLRAHKRTVVPPPRLPDGVPMGVAQYVVRLLAKKPWQRWEFAADARKAWMLYRPAHAPTLEETVAGPITSRPTVPTEPAAVVAARSLAAGIMSMRPSPMIARDDERTQLMALVDEVCTGKGAPHRMIAMIGEAGVGKSRLAEWLSEQVHESAKMIPMRARYGRTPSPLDGVTGAVNNHFGLEGADRALVEQTLINRWEVAKEDDEALSWVAAAAEWLRPTPPGTVPPLGPTGKRFVLDTAEIRAVVVRRILEKIGSDRPILMWFDDLHYTSPSTFEMLSRLHRDAPKLRILLVATARSETLETDLDAALRMESLRAEWNGRVLDLKPLGEGDTESLLRATLPLHDDAVARGISQSRGNPLFALQLLHAWAGGGYLKMEHGRYRVPDDALEGRAITTAELWDERLRAVPTSLREAAYAAAAIGDDVRGEVLKTLVSALGMDPRDALLALTRAQILLPAGNDQFRWPHALLQEHLLARLHERNDAPAIFRLAANALAKHPAVGSRRIMKHRVTNLLRAGDDDVAAQLMFRFIEGSWRRGRDTAATLRDLELIEGRVTGLVAAEYAYWRSEALRHTGKFDEAREQAEASRRAFEVAGDRRREAHSLRLLGHIASDLGAPAQGRLMVAQAMSYFEQLHDEAGRAQALVVLGEIDYLLGEHARAREMLSEAAARCSALGDSLGRAQCLILQAMIATAVGGFQRARELLMESRQEFDNIGYRLGIAQCDTVLGHADHRAFEMDRARVRALAARAAFRELQNPRGEAACERLLAMIAVDTDDFAAAQAHALITQKLFDKLQDPWGELESKLLLAQIALARQAPEAARLVAECEQIVLDEAEPRQHRHLTNAWLAQRQQRWNDASNEIDRARAAFGDKARCGDHTPHLLTRFSKLHWVGPALAKIDAWMQVIERQAAGAPTSDQMPVRIG